MSVCREERDCSAAVLGRGMLSVRVRSMGRSVSRVSSVGGAARGERSGKVRLCSWRVWWVRWVVRAECAVINLKRGGWLVSREVEGEGG